MEMLMTRNGQITIPKEYRESLGLREGSRVIIGQYGGGLLLRPAKKYPWELPGKSGFTDEIVAMMKKYREESHWRYP